MKEKRFRLTSHACRYCGGRILEQLNPGPTGGGNPVFFCADCERVCCGMEPNAICWCGFAQRGQIKGDWFCAHLDEVKAKPWLRDAFGHCGVDVMSDRAPRVAMLNRQIVIQSEQRYQQVLERQQGQRPGGSDRFPYP